MSNERNIEVLNDVTAKLIDSCKGYELCADVAKDNLALKMQFEQRRDSRASLVNEFQSIIGSHGAQFEDSGTVAGTFHRGYTKFVSLFKDDAEAAFDALDTGEKHLAEYIGDQLSQSGLTLESTTLLTKAHLSAREGKRFASYADE